MTRQDRRNDVMRPIDHVAMFLTGAILLGFLVAFERWAAGSWRELGALLLAMAVWFGGGFALDAGLRRIGRFGPGTPPPVWLLAVPPMLGAAAGAAYGLAAVGHLGRPVLIGAVAGTVLAVLNCRRFRRRRSAEPHRPPSDESLKPTNTNRSGPSPRNLQSSP